MGGGIPKLLLSLILCVVLFSCGHGNGEKGGKPNDQQNNPNEEKTTEPKLKTFTINGENAKGGSLTFQGTNVTIEKINVIIDFEETDAPKNFTCSKNFPITIQAGKEETLEFYIAKTNKYKEWKRTVLVSCTNLKVLKIVELKVHEEEVNKDDFTIKLDEEKREITANNVGVKFEQSDAPSHTFEGLPITLKAGQTNKFKIKTEANATYAKFEKEVTVICKVKQEPKDLKLKKITVHGEEAKADVFLIPLEHATVSKENIKVYFEEEDAPKEAKCEPASLNVTEVEQELKIYTDATSKYKKFERTIKIKHQEKKGLTLKNLTIHGLNAKSGKVTIGHASVTENNVGLKFIEKDGVPTSFKLEPQPLTLNHNEAKKLTISTEETARYKAFSIEVEVKREKEASAEKTIDDVVEALRGKLKWADSQVSENIELFNTVEGFTGSTVEWKSLNEKYCDDTGKIKKDIVNVKVELEATVKWNGQEKKVKFTTTIERIKKIRKKYSNPLGTHTEEYNFEEENVLVLLKDDKPRAKFELKSVDVEKKEFVAQLKQRANEDGVLIDLENWESEGIKLEIQRIKNIFGATFIKLRKQTTITWEDLKGYILGVFENLSPQSTDEEIFNAGNRLIGLENKTWNEFNALSDEEKTKFIKKGMQKSINLYMGMLGIPRNTPDEEIAKKLTETFLLNEKASKEIAGRLSTYGYKLVEETDPNYLDHLSFKTTSKYDSKREWYDQCSSKYYCDTNHEIEMSAKKLENQLSIDVGIGAGNEYRLHVPISNTFTLENRYNGEKLHCTVSNVHDGKLTLSTTGAVTGTYEMTFKEANSGIIDILGMLM